MGLELKNKSKSLYDSDYNLWVLQTVQQLENQDFQALDLENLIEEVLDLSKRDKRRIESLLTRLFEHLLKLAYWESEKKDNQNCWQREIRNFRKQLNKELKVSPSLKNYFQEIFGECYQDSRELLADLSGLSLDTFPEKPIGTVEQILDENWFLANVD